MLDAVCLGFREGRLRGTGGINFRITANPSDEIYALEFESGTWLIDTPLLGELVLTLVSSGRATSTSAEWA